MRRTKRFWKRAARAVMALGVVAVLLAAAPIVLTAFVVRAVCGAIKSKSLFSISPHTSRLRIFRHT